MITLTTLKTALAQYIDTEIIAHLQDWRKWAIGIGSAVYLNKIDVLVDQHRDMLMEMGYLTADGEIDIEKAYKDFRKQADKKGDIKVVLPIIGEVKIGATDLDKLYGYATGNIK